MQLAQPVPWRLLCQDPALTLARPCRSGALVMSLFARGGDCKAWFHTLKALRAYTFASAERRFGAAGANLCKAAAGLSAGCCDSDVLLQCVWGLYRLQPGETSSCISPATRCLMLLSCQAPLLLTLCLPAVSGTVPEEPVINRNSGLLFEKRLVEKHVQVCCSHTCVLLFCSHTAWCYFPSVLLYGPVPVYRRRLARIPSRAKRRRLMTW